MGTTTKVSFRDFWNNNDVLVEILKSELGQPILGINTDGMSLIPVWRPHSCRDCGRKRTAIRGGRVLCPYCGGTCDPDAKPPRSGEKIY